MQEIKCLEDIISFTVKLGGRNSVDAENFSSIIQSTIFLMKESASTICPEAFLKLEIRANKEGSFESIIDTVLKSTPDLLKDGIPFCKDILQIVLHWLNIKQHLKGNKPKKIITENNDAIIINQDNEEFRVGKNILKKYLDNINIENSIVKIFINAEEDNRSGLEIIPDKKSKLPNKSFAQNEFAHMAKHVIEENNKIEHIIQPPIEVTLLIKKPDLNGKSQWTFLYNKTINAYVKDEEFLDKIQNKHTIKICGGFRIKCLLQMEYDLSDGEIVEGSEKYFITKVIEVIEPPIQQNLNL